MNAYHELEKLFGKIGRLRSIQSILQWDFETMMPSGSAALRADQLAFLETAVHELLTARSLDDLFAKADRDQRNLDAWQKANLDQMRRIWSHSSALSAELVAALSNATTHCTTAWRDARPHNDFAALREPLEQVVALTREKAQAVAARLGCSLYDALLDEFDPGASSGDIDRLFSELEAFLPALTETIIERQNAAGPADTMSGTFPKSRQRKLGRLVMERLGFDFARGRVDESQHPFCGGWPGDIRLTTRYRETNFTEGLMGTIHETGHSLYELGLPEPWRYQPVGMARSMSLHESQSLLFEMQACRGRAFLTWLAPEMRKVFGLGGPEWSVESIQRHYTRVARTLIRVDADEVTYSAHIVLRYQLERDLIDGRLAVADLPEAWRTGMQRLLGVVVPDDRDGCMQDIHWPSGAIGYFPTYTLGALTAAQLFETAHKQIATLDDDLARAEFGGLLAWLREHVHQFASSKSPNEILVQATGRPLEVAPYRRHLHQRFIDGTK